jgi:serine/threonine-protein kinase
MQPTTSDRESFLQHLQQSGLLPGDQYREALARFRPTAGAAEIARALVGAGKLTRFQARVLLRGHSSGFFVGPYRILDLVGKGAMGRVYKALHQDMNRIVALKVLSPSLVKTEKARQLFRNEVQTAAQLNHPNIVLAYDANGADGKHYLAMEYISGVTVSQLVHQRGRLPAGLACEVIRQAALGLAHAHERGLVHRDVKPANLMVSTVRRPPAKPLLPLELGLQVKILDFGLARLNRQAKHRPSNETDDGRHPITGTPDYMSPEQARNRNVVDIRSDLYSLGCTFYYLLTGQVPFPGGTILDKLIRHQSELPVAPEVVQHRIPPAVAEIVLKLMAKDPADRYQTPQELADALAPHAHSGALHTARRRRHRAEPASVPAATMAERTLGAGPEDTSPLIDLAPKRIEEAEALSSWVQARLGQRRRWRRLLQWAVAGAMLAAGAAALLWWQFM